MAILVSASVSSWICNDATIQKNVTVQYTAAYHHSASKFHDIVMLQWHFKLLFIMFAISYF